MNRHFTQNSHPEDEFPDPKNKSPQKISNSVNNNGTPGSRLLSNYMHNGHNGQYTPSPATPAQPSWEYSHSPKRSATPAQPDTQRFIGNTDEPSYFVSSTAPTSSTPYQAEAALAAPSYLIQPDTPDLPMYGQQRYTQPGESRRSSQPSRVENRAGAASHHAVSQLPDPVRVNPPWHTPSQYPAPPRFDPAQPYQPRRSNAQPPRAPASAPPRLQRKKRHFPLWLRMIATVLLVFLLLGGGVFAYYQIEIAPSLNNIISHNALHGRNGADMGISDLTALRRINILLLGSDNDGKGNDGHNGAPLAQTDIVVTIDQQAHTVGMLSIPRDLQVSIPDHQPGKMDFAFSYGWQAANPQQDDAAKAQRAAGLAEDTITANFGIRIDRYAWVGLQGFVKVIDTVGGVDVDVTHPMVDDSYPDDVNNPNGNVTDYKRLYIAPGPQHLTGQQALEYVRTRHSDLAADFGRSARQQQVLSSLKTKLTGSEILDKLPDLVKDLNGFVLTDMNLNDLAFLGNLARGIDVNAIQRVTLSPPYSTPSQQPGNSNFLPVCDQIRPQLTKLFDSPGLCIPQTDNG